MRGPVSNVSARRKALRLLVSPGPDDRPLWKLAQESLGHVATPTDRSTFRKRVRQLLCREVLPFHGFSVDDAHQGGSVINVAEGFNGLVTIDALLALEPLGGDVPDPMVRRTVFDLAQAILITGGLAVEAGAVAQLQMASIHEFVNGGATGGHFDRGGLVIFRAGHQHQAVEFPGISCSEQTAKEERRSDDQ
jgi:hypothetical protein